MAEGGVMDAGSPCPDGATGWVPEDVLERS
jgi:hypothetical protein